MTVSRSPPGDPGAPLCAMRAGSQPPRLRSLSRSVSASSSSRVDRVSFTMTAWYSFTRSKNNGYPHDRATPAHSAQGHAAPRPAHADEDLQGAARRDRDVDGV